MLEALLPELVGDVTHITDALLKSHEMWGKQIESAPGLVGLNSTQFYYSLLLFTIKLQARKVFLFYLTILNVHSCNSASPVVCMCDHICI